MAEENQAPVHSFNPTPYTCRIAKLNDSLVGMFLK